MDLYEYFQTGSLEGITARKTGKLVPLSQQNPLDCSRSAGNLGCSGGTPNNAFTYIKNAGGVDTYSSYPYTGGSEGTCRFNKANVGATCTGYKTIPSGNETALMQAVGTIGPVST